MFAGCVLRSPGVEVEIEVCVAPAPDIGLRLAEIDLVPCPGTRASSAHEHSHDSVASEAISLEQGSMRILATPRAGRYCDVRLRLEADEAVARQALLRLECRERFVELTLDDPTDRAQIRVSGTSHTALGTGAQQRLDAVVRSLRAQACGDSED